MALPPTIPTSFVPRSAAAPKQRLHMDFMGAFGVLSYLVFAMMLALTVGVFVYGRILAGELASKDAELEAAQKAINRPMAEEFVRLNNRLSESQSLLANHVALSGFYDKLEERLPLTVRFSGLTVTATEGKKVKIVGSGVAKSFNALASASDRFAEDGRIKDAIFSKMSVNKDNSVSFALTATLDPELVSFNPSAEPAPAPVVSAPVATSTTP